VGRMNWYRIILGGLIAGMVINAIDYFLRTIVLQPGLEAVRKAFSTPPEAMGASFAMLAICSFLTGTAAVWLYAAIVPRFGAGRKAVLSATLAVWIPGYCAALVPPFAARMLPAGIVFPMMAVGFLEVCLGVAIGGWLYRDHSEVKFATQVAAGGSAS
jgi:hypothetical protein